MITGLIEGELLHGYGVNIEWTDTPVEGQNKSVLELKTYIVHRTLNISARTDRHSTTIDGVKETFSTDAIRTSVLSSPTLVNTRTVTIDHDDDGSKSVEISASFSFGYTTSDGYKISSRTASGTIQLEQLYLADKVTSYTNPCNVAWVFRLSVDRKIDHWHKATITYGSVSQVLDPFQDSAETFLINDFGLAIGNDTGKAVLSVQTYSDEECTQPIGDPLTYDLTLEPHEQPVCLEGWFTAEADNSTAGITGFVQGHTRLTCSYDSSKILIGLPHDLLRVDFTIRSSSGKVYAPGEILTTSGTHTITAKATDTLGAYHTESTTITVTAYSTPTINCNKADCFRAIDAAGNKGDGNYLRVLAKGVISGAGNGNTVTMTCKWRYNYSTGAYTVQPMTSNQVCVYSPFLLERSYEIVLTATDSFGNSATFSFILPSDSITFNAMRGGRGFAFGKYAEKPDTVQSAWDIETDGKLTCKELQMMEALQIGSGGTGGRTASEALAALGAAPTQHTHTPQEAGAAPVQHTHTKSEITDFPEHIGADTTIVSEEVQIGTFLGDPLYRQVQTVTNISNLTVPSGYDKIIHIYGYALSNNGYVFMVNTYQNSSHYFYIYPDGSTLTKGINFGSTDRKLVRAEIIFEYTKTGG